MGTSRTTRRPRRRQRRCRRPRHPQRDRDPERHGNRDADTDTEGDARTDDDAADSTPTPAPTAIPVSTCRVIDEPGVYVLTQNLKNRPEDVCIDIRASDVTFDGGGHVVDSAGLPSTAAVLARDPGGGQLIDVTVRDVTVSDWNLGIRYRNLTASAVTDVEVHNNSIGVSLRYGSDIAITDVIGSLNGGLGWEDGTIVVEYTPDSMVTNASSKPKDAALYGYLVEDTTNVTVTEISFDSDAGSAVYLLGARISPSATPASRRGASLGTRWGSPHWTDPRSVTRRSTGAPTRGLGD